MHLSPCADIHRNEPLKFQISRREPITDEGGSGIANSLPATHPSACHSGSLFAFVLWRSLALKLTVRDLDNWWHLKVGDWILQNHAFPHTGIFSATAANRPWAAYSWGYEILLSLWWH